MVIANYQVFRAALEMKCRSTSTRKRLMPVDVGNMPLNEEEGINQNIDELRKNVISALKKKDGTPADELVALMANPDNVDKLKIIFKDEQLTNASDLLEALNNKDNFDQLFEIID